VSGSVAFSGVTYDDAAGDDDKHHCQYDQLPRQIVPFLKRLGTNCSRLHGVADCTFFGIWNLLSFFSFLIFCFSSSRTEIDFPAALF
jgi:hypothetical protein